MRLLPASLAGRLTVTALFATVVAMLLASWSIGHVLERFVMHGLDDRLDTQIALLSRAVRADGTIDSAQTIDLPPFDRAGSGWEWEIVAPAQRLRSASLAGADIVLPPGIDTGPPPPPPGELPNIHPLDGRGPDGLAIHGRVASIPSPAGPVRIVATGPRAVVDRPLREAAVPLLVSLLLLGGILLAALIAQLRVGLRPLRRLQAMVGEVRDGRRRRLDLAEPTELLPLVGELNGLLDASEAALERARGHVANLAHGLKTPLATLRLDLSSTEGGDALVPLVDRMKRQIRHHLGRARTGETTRIATPQVPLAPLVSGLVEAMSRIHRERAIAAAIEIGDDIAVRCDRQDLDELLGNILDNAWRHARSKVRVRAVSRGLDVMIDIEDDGPGMAPADLAIALAKGVRLDESEPGHGFGLSISRELTELHHGRLRLERSADLHGLAVRISLPAGSGTAG